METPAFSEDIAFGLNGPEILVIGGLALATYYVGKKIFQTINGTSN